MRKFILMAGVVAVGAACGSGADMLGEMLDSGVPDAGAQPGEEVTRMQYVGVSTEAVQATGGVFPMYAACRAAFGADHRMCTQAEILNTANVPTVPEGTSWYMQDLNSAPCGGYSRSTSSGNTLYAPTLNQVGQLIQQGCGNTLTVACCGPK